MSLTMWDYLCVPSGLLIFGVYHVWLLYTIIQNPKRTVIGLNAENRKEWVHCLMADPLQNGVLAIQTLRNNLLATTKLSTISITLSSLITALVSSLSSSSASSLWKIRSPGEITTTYPSTFIKYFSVLVCFLMAFFGNLQAMRCYAHVSFLITVSSSTQERSQSIDFVVRHLNRGGLFWSFGMRAFYLSFPMLLWIFGSLQMFLCCCLMTFVLYFLDTTSHFDEGWKE